jgi:hypothetical protein
MSLRFAHKTALPVLENRPKIAPKISQSRPPIQPHYGTPIRNGRHTAAEYEIHTVLRVTGVSIQGGPKTCPTHQASGSGSCVSRGAAARSWQVYFARPKCRGLRLSCRFVVAGLVAMVSNRRGPKRDPQNEGPLLIRPILEGPGPIFIMGLGVPGARTRL